MPKTYQTEKKGTRIENQLYTDVRKTFSHFCPFWNTQRESQLTNWEKSLIAQTTVLKGPVVLNTMQYLKR